MNRMSINGLTIETNKGGISMTGTVVVFSDGSTYNTRTGAFNNAGPGFVKVNGMELNNSEGDSQKSSENASTTQSHDFKSTSLSLKVVSADVSVEAWNGPGMRVELTGPSNLVDAIKLTEGDSVLTIDEGGSSGGSNGSVVISNGFVSSSFGGDLFVGGMHIGGGRGNVSVTNFGGTSALSIKVLVPSGTSITITAVASDVRIRDVAGPLSVNINGSADVTATNASGNVQVNIAGSGDVRIGDGNIANLGVSIAGSGDVHFGGTAQNAMLNVTGSGDIRVKHVVNQPMKNVSGSGSIEVAEVG